MLACAYVGQSSPPHLHQEISEQRLVLRLVPGDGCQLFLCLADQLHDSLLPCLEHLDTRLVELLGRFAAAQSEQNLKACPDVGDPKAAPLSTCRTRFSPQPHLYSIDTGAELGPGLFRTIWESPVRAQAT